MTLRVRDRVGRGDRLDSATLPWCQQGPGRAGDLRFGALVGSGDASHARRCCRGRAGFAEHKFRRVSQHAVSGLHAQMITAFVLATTVISVFATPGGTGQRERKGVTGVDHGSAVNATDQGLLQLIYDLMSQRGAWPTFTAVDLRADRDLGVEDAQAALLAIPEGYIAKPWQAHGFSDSDAVRLTLRGVTMCAGGRQDLDLLAQFVAWVVKVESKASDWPSPAR